MGEIECPYCGADCGVPEEPSGEGEYEEFECEECGKSFMYYASYSVNYYSEKAPCLNGGKHKWEKMVGAPKEFFEDTFRNIQIIPTQNIMRMVDLTENEEIIWNEDLL